MLSKTHNLSLPLSLSLCDPLSLSLSHTHSLSLSLLYSPSFQKQASTTFTHVHVLPTCSHRAHRCAYVSNFSSTSLISGGAPTAHSLNSQALVTGGLHVSSWFIEVDILYHPVLLQRAAVSVCSTGGTTLHTQYTEL